SFPAMARYTGNLRFRNFFRVFWALALATSLIAYTASVTPDRRATLDRISADSLKGHISFLASDLLEGRDTPSRGLDVAAEYLASPDARPPVTTATFKRCTSSKPSNPWTAPN